jgi:hypothetical protein
MALVHTFTNLALPILMLPILKPNHKYLAYGYLSFAIMATLILVVGTLFSLLLIPLSEEYVKAGSTMTSNFETMGILLKKASFLPTTWEWLYGLSAGCCLLLHYTNQNLSQE